MSIITGKEDRRVHPRVNYHSQLRYQLRGSSEFENAVTSDISTGGLRFTCDRFIPTQAPLMLEINLLNRILHPIGRVAWSSPLPHSDRNQLGVEFLEFDPTERHYLRDFVEMQLNA